MTALESDLKRLVQNAKEFNSTKSEVYEDAERIRKAMSNFMPKHNPAYLDHTYRAAPTPIPQGLVNAPQVGTSTPAPHANGSQESLKVTIPNTLGRNRKSAANVTTKEDEPDEDLISKQVEIIEEMMELTNSE